MLACCVLAAVAVAIDAYFSAQEGYLARPLDYDGVSYVVTARTHDLLLRSLHVNAALHGLLGSVSPLWVSMLTIHQLVLGDGGWPVFAGRFWAAALLLILVYWIVSRRANRPLALAAVGLTAVLPLVSAGVRASSWELLSGQANYYEDWYLDDLRPDLLTIVLTLWSVAALAEHVQAPRRSAYLVSAGFAAAATLAKSSTAPVVLVAWAALLGVSWFWNRRSQEATRMTVVAVILLALLLLPWAVLGGGLQTVVIYLEGIQAFQAAYASSGGFFGGFTYFLVRIPNQIGQLEASVVIAGSLVLLAPSLRWLTRSEAIYAGLVPFFYLVFSLPTSKNPVIGEWTSLALWIFFLAAGSRVVVNRWRARVNSALPVTLGAVAAYVLLVYGLGAFAIAAWPANERRSNAQLVSVTADVAGELGRHVSSRQCFAYAPGPGWPASLTYSLMDANGNAPISTAIDVDPNRTTVTDYVAAASLCSAVLTYREEISEVAKVFFAPPVRQPYLQAVAEWVRSPVSGYALDRTWRMSDLAPSGPHTLGHYQGVSLTLDLYLRQQP